jgi:hypothetical protein
MELDEAWGKLLRCNMKYCRVILLELLIKTLAENLTQNVTNSK